MDWDLTWRIVNTAGVLGLTLFIVVLGSRGNVWVWRREKDAETARADTAEKERDFYRDKFMHTLDQQERLANAFLTMTEADHDRKRRG